MLGNIACLITDQAATAPCTDRVQEWFRTLEAELCDRKKAQKAQTLTELCAFCASVAKSRGFGRGMTAPIRQQALESCALKG